MAIKVTSKKGSATSSKVIKDKGKVLAEEATTETVDLPKEGSTSSTGPWCEVGVEASYTHNLGNYQSARIGVTLKVPCNAPEIDEVFEYAQSWVDTKMQKLMADLQE